MNTHYTSKFSNPQISPEDEEMKSNANIHKNRNNGSDEGNSDSENQDEVHDTGSHFPYNKIQNRSTHHDYSEIDFSGDEVFELPSNSESFNAGTLFRAGRRCYHDKIKEAELGQIIFRARLMVKQRELSIKNKNANPTNIERKLTRDEEYFPLNPEHSRRKLQKIAKQVCKKRTEIVDKINKGLSESQSLED